MRTKHVCAYIYIHTDILCILLYIYMAYADKILAQFLPVKGFACSQCSIDSCGWLLISLTPQIAAAPSGKAPPLKRWNVTSRSWVDQATFLAFASPTDRGSQVLCYAMVDAKSYGRPTITTDFWHRGNIPGLMGDEHIPAYIRSSDHGACDQCLLNDLQVGGSETKNHTPKNGLGCCIYHIHPSLLQYPVDIAILWLNPT